MGIRLEMVAVALNRTLSVVWVELQDSVKCGLVGFSLEELLLDACAPHR